MSEHSSDADRMSPAGPPPAANQRRTEPMPEKEPAEETAAGPGAPTAAAAPGPGGPGEQVSARPAIAVPGKPDGEVDTRV